MPCGITSNTKKRERNMSSSRVKVYRIFETIDNVESLIEAHIKGELSEQGNRIVQNLIENNEEVRDIYQTMTGQKKILREPHNSALFSGD